LAKLNKRFAMAQNKVQYQRGLPMLEFFEDHGSQEPCEELVRG
jgi:hypothetical protein